MLFVLFRCSRNRAQIPHSSRNQTPSKKAKQTLPIRPEMPKRTALLVCNFLSGRAKPHPEQKEKSGFSARYRQYIPSTLNFSYKYDSTASQKCQGRQNIHRSSIFPSLGRLSVFKQICRADRFSTKSAQKKDTNLNFARSKYYLRYFANIHPQISVISAVFSRFSCFGKEEKLGCQLYLPTKTHLTAWKAIPKTFKR